MVGSKFTSSGTRALNEIIVAEICSSPGGCFTTSLLADFGAVVWICEALPNGSTMRSKGPSDWWKILARNKKSVALDPIGPDSAHIGQQLLSHIDVVVTDVPSRQHASHPLLRQLSCLTKKPLIAEVITTGSDKPEAWPWSLHPEMAAASTGLMALTGEKDCPPVQPEFPLTEYLSGTLAALRIILALRKEKIDGTLSTQALVNPMHLALNRMIEWQLPVASITGRAEVRNGNAFPLGFSIGNIFLTADGKYITVSAANDNSARKLLTMLGGETLSSDVRYSTLKARRENLNEIYEIIHEWMSHHTSEQVIEKARQHDVVLGQVYNSADIESDEHMSFRGNLISFPEAGTQPLVMPGVIPHITGWPNEVRSLGPELGADNEEIFSAYGIDVSSK